MTQEDKELLLKDLCARLPYGVMCDAYPWQQDKPRLLVECVPEYCGEEIVLKGLAGRHSFSEAKIKPYLRPMSSMTEEEAKEFDVISDNLLVNGTSTEIWNTVIDWLNEHYFDHRNLIEKGLALEAPDGMYKTE